VKLMNPRIRRRERELAEAAPDSERATA
jgi:hypothetical protein